MLRIAEWPIDTLTRLDAPDLWTAAYQSAPDLVDRYAAATSAQRDVLAELTTTAGFDRALTLANAEVAQRWRDCGGRVRSAKSRHRRLEATVVRFLCRAAGRATPQGAWAGVCAVTDAPGGDRLVSVAPAPGAWVVAPSLAPFAALCSWIGAGEPYLRKGRFALDPTLHRRQDRWRILGPGGWRELPEHPFLDSLVAWLHGAGEPERGALQPFVASLASAPASEAGVWEALAGLRSTGVIRPVLRVDPVGEGAAAILRRTAADLPDAMRHPWLDAVTALEAAAGALSRDLGEIDGAETTRRLGGAAAVLAELWQRLNVPGCPPGGASGLRVDRVAPFAAHWSAAGREVVSSAVAELLEIHAADGAAEHYRRQDVARLRSGSLLDELWRLTTLAPSARASEALPPLPGGTLTRAGVVAAHYGRRDRFAVEERWDVLAAGAGGGPVVVGAAALTGPWSVPDDADLPRCGAQVLVVDGSTVHLGWGRPQPLLFAGRHLDLGVAASTSAELAADLARSGCELTDVVVRDPQSLDASVRLPTTPMLDLSDRAQVAELDLVVDTESRTVEVRQAGRPLLVSTASAVGSSGRDPLSILGELLTNVHGWEMLSFGLPLTEAETVGRQPIAAVHTPSGHVLRTRRVALDPDWVEAARALVPVERYRAWVAALRAAGLAGSTGTPGSGAWAAGNETAGLVSVQCGQEPPLVVPASSPLAVEALFGVLRAGSWVVVADIAPATLVVDGTGRQHVAELAVSWWRT